VTLLRGGRRGVSTNGLVKLMDYQATMIESHSIDDFFPVKGLLLEVKFRIISLDIVSRSYLGI